MNSLDYCSKLQDFQLNGIRDIAFSYGVSLDGLCETFGYNLDGELDLRDLDQIVKLLCETIQRPWAPLEFVYKMTFYQIGTIGPLLASCGSFRDAVKLFETYQPLLHPGFVVSADTIASGQMAFKKYANDSFQAPSWHAEAMFSGIVYWGKLLVDRPIVIDEVWFRHAKPDYADKYYDFFRCEKICFEKEYDSIFLNGSNLDLSIKTASHQFHLRMKREADMRLQELRPFSSMVKNIIHAKLPHDCSIGEVADSLNCSIRTFQRKLEEDGATLKQLKQDVKFQEATRMLEKTAFSVDRIAERLGYSQRKSFSSAFEKWTGRTPAEWRAHKQR